MIELLITATVLCNNFNYTAPPCNAPPQTLNIDAEGNFTGVLESGIPYSQTNIVNSVTKLQRFQLQDAYWYVSNKGIIWADSNLQALSIYLTL